VSGAQGRLDQLTGDVTWNGPTEAVTPPKGMKVVGIHCNLAFTGCKAAADNQKAAADALGWDYVAINATDPAKFGSYTQEALNQKPDAITTDGFNCVGWPKNLLEQVKSAGIPVVDEAGSATSECTDAQENWNWEQVGKAMADAAIVNNDGKANVINLVSNEYDAAFKPNEEAVKQLKAECPDCKVVDTVQFTTADLQSALGPKVVAAARSNPDANALFVPLVAVASMVRAALH
jgi:ribose transport system substrate-binding protein